MVFGVEIPFIAHCGIEALEIVEGRTRLRLVPGPDSLNQLGIVHGGLLATLADVAMGSAARHAAGRAVMTLDMQVAFLNPGRGTLLAEGRVVRPGRSVMFTEAEIRDEAGELVVRATGLMKPVRPEVREGEAMQGKAMQGEAMKGAAR
jgi:uncharacterized protein (TIGR00369 family)